MFTPEQHKIYDGLKNIGGNLANFYLDGVRMMQPDCTMGSKANLIAHVAREIDSGLRQMFAPLEVKKLNEKELKLTSGHFASILAALGTPDVNNSLANEWLNVGQQLHKVAHRAELHLDSKEMDEVSHLWERHQRVLYAIIGSYLNISNRLDVLMKQESPQNDILPSLKNILKDSKNAHYFFTNLDKPRWLGALEALEIFEPYAAPVKVSHNSQVEYWYALSYLETISRSVTGKPAESIKVVIGKIMDAYTTQKIDLNDSTIQTITQILGNIPNSRFSTEVRAFYESYSRRSLNISWSLTHSILTEKVVKNLVLNGDQDSLINLLEYYFGFSNYKEDAISLFFDKENIEAVIKKKPYVETFYLRELARLYGTDIVKILGITAMKIAIRSLVQVQNMGDYTISVYGIASIEPSSQSGYSHDWEHDLIFFIRDYSKNLEKQQLVMLCGELVTLKPLILRRLGIHLINEHFGDLAGVWWNYIETSDSSDYLNIHEVYVLLKKHSSTFNDEQFNKIINWIEALHTSGGNSDLDGDKHINAYTIRRWLNSMKPNSEESQALLNDKIGYYKSLNNAPLSEHPEFDSYGTFSIGPDFPTGVEDYENWEIEKQVEYISGYKPEHGYKNAEEGLGHLLREAFVNKPEKYLAKLNAFVPLHSLYLSYLIDGVQRVMEGGKYEDIETPLNFIVAKIADNSYAKEVEQGFRYKGWLVSSIASLINTIASRHKIRRLSNNEIDSIIKLIFDLLNRPEFQDNNVEIQGSYIDHVLNSSAGKLYGALMQLLIAGVENKTKAGEANLWPIGVKEHLTERLRNFESFNKDFSIRLGMELELLHHIDKDWVEQEIEHIFSKENFYHYDLRLETAFTNKGYPSLAIYNIYKDLGIFDRGIDHFTGATQGLKTLLKYGILEWQYWGGDPENGGVIGGLLKKKNDVQLWELVQAARIHNLDKDKATYLWKKIDSLLELDPDLTKVYDVLGGLFELINEVTKEMYELLIKIVSKNDGNVQAINVILKHLYEVADTNIELSGKIALHIFDKMLAGAYYHGELPVFVEKLYNNGYKDVADKICNAISDWGSLTLKDTYNKFN